MGKYKFGASSNAKLANVHSDLRRVMELAISRSEVDFKVIEGRRTKARQAQLVASGASKTMNSRHLTGHAVDVMPLVNGKGRWDWPLYHKIAPVIKQAAKDLGVKIDWGGDWKNFKDGPHFELNWKAYPIKK